ncbi:MAG: 50S ribosomal protein L19 [Phycisphaeraceae bacterium]|nr:50S ribosomal protein L19 [Phycisphaeraceae bacterium]
MSQQQIIDAVEKKFLKTDLPKLSIGDTVDVHVRIIEGSKERIQVFNGVVIAQSGRGIGQMITVRRIVANEGVERVFPLHSPRISTIEVKRQGHVRRSKLYYLRERVGKKRRLRDKRRGLEQLITEPEKAVETEAAVATAGKGKKE